MRKAVDTLLFSGDFTPTTFNLAFFMHSLFREDIERESKSLSEEKDASYIEFLTETGPLPRAAATPVPGMPAETVMMPAAGPGHREVPPPRTAAPSAARTPPVPAAHAPLPAGAAAAARAPGPSRAASTASPRTRTRRRTRRRARRTPGSRSTRRTPRAAARCR